MSQYQGNEVELIQEAGLKAKAIKSEIAKAIVGQDEIIEQLMISLFAKGHCLLVGVPGLAKTLLIKTLSNVLDLKFGRIQFTPDLMPSDITGTEIIEEDPISKKRNFKFIPGPIFANIILADEINRTPPKTQAALLEAMQEQRVTIAGKSYLLDNPFFVLATQNPIEQEGTYPLPEAQLDRFMFNLWLDYPSREEEIQIIKNTTSGITPHLDKVISISDLLTFQQLVQKVPVADNLIEAVADIVGKTRVNTAQAPDYIKEWIRWGAGPRAGQNLILAAKARAVLDGRYTPSLEDIKFCMLPVLRHRLITNFSAESEGIGSSEIIHRLMEEL